MAPIPLGRKFIGWIVVFVISQATIARVLGPVAPRVIEAQLAMSARRYTAVLDKMDDTETARYRRHFYLDFVHPAIYAIALRTGARRLAELTPLSPTTQKILAVAPVASAAGDYIENVAGLYLLDHRGSITNSVVRTFSAVSIVKWVLALGVLAFLSQGFVRVWAVERLQN